MKIKANGIEIEYETFGDKGGPTLLLIMGLGAQLTLWPEDLCHKLTAKGFYVIRYDNRDVGLSTKLDAAGVPDMPQIFAGTAKPAYTLDDMAADAAALLDALGVAKAHIVGASMGGMIAQLVAANHPEKTLSLTSIMSTTGNHGGAARHGGSHAGADHPSARRYADGQAGRQCGEDFRRDRQPDL